mmetsp:Transcript_134202/g.261373  ORF Transcript_134202/g.261373 Transcript_134202/m.261373 type:complete len:684 (-) Transcript_134202:176-2227(-)
MGSSCGSGQGAQQVEKAESQKIKVYVKGAEGLPAVDWFPGTDRFLYFGVGADVGGDEFFKSRTMRNVVDPVWDEEFDIPANIPLRFTIFQADADWKTDVVASATLDLAASGADQLNSGLPLAKDGKPTGSSLMLRARIMTVADAGSVPASDFMCKHYKRACCVQKEKRNFAERRPSVAILPASDAHRRPRNLKQTLCRKHNGKKLGECYTVECVIGQGEYGIVKKAHLNNCSDITRAIKQVPKRDMRVNLAVCREVSVLQRLDHPSVCRIFETFEDDRNIYLVMEYVEGRELLAEMVENLDNHRFDEARYAAIMGEVFRALQYLHHHEVLHRDLKPENIMVCQRAENSRRRPHIKLVDFGLAVLTQPYSGRYNIYQKAGTKVYLAPEALDHGMFSLASDMWSTGIIIFMMFLGHFPERTMVQHGISTVRSDSARNILEGLLQEDPGRRISAANAARHPWVRNGHIPLDSQQSGDLQKVGKSFVDFYQSDKLRRAALTAVALHDTSQMDALREQFDLIDLDGNGVIAKDELTRALQELPHADVKDMRIWADALFEELDSDGSGGIEFTQWQAAALMSSTEISDAVMRAAFQTMDMDSTGSISSENLSRILQVSGAELNSIMKGADLNGDGVIDFEEFKAIFTRLAPQVSSNYVGLSEERSVLHSDAPTPSFSCNAWPWTGTFTT